MRLNSAPLQIKRADPTQGRFTALASTWELDREKDRIERGAFANTLADWAARGGRVPVLWDHNTAEPIGAIESATETDEGLEVTAVIALSSPRAIEAHALLKAGGMSLSIGYMLGPNDFKIVEGVRVIHRLELVEISVVAVPANAGAVVRDVKALFPNARALEHALRDRLGLSNRQAKRLVTGGYAALAGADDEPLEPSESQTATRAALAQLRKAFEP